MSRYARQTALPEVGQTGQASLRTAHVLVVGAGGLAAPALPYLAGAGVGRITVIDPDTVSRSNLHRQTLFTDTQIGVPKVTAAAARLTALNPEVTVTPLHAAVDPANACDLVAGADVILDCADSFAISYILSDACLASGKPLSSASVVGLSGYVGGFCAGAPSLRAIFPDLPRRLGSCAQDGVLGPVVGVLGSLQAQMALSLITGAGVVPLGRITTFDAATGRFGGFVFRGAPEPARVAPFIALEAIAPTDFIADLRGEEEAPLIHPAAQRIPTEAFGPGGPCPVHDQRAVLVCRSGQRAWTAAERLSAQWSGDIALVAAGDTATISAAGDPIRKKDLT